MHNHLMPGALANLAPTMTAAQRLAAIQTVGGNTALALLLTVLSNLLGVFSMPFVLCRILGASGSGISIDPKPLLINLLKTILLPLLLGATARAGAPGEQQ